MLEQAGCGDCGVVDHGNEGVDYLGEVMGWDVGRHAHSDAARSIKQQLGNRCRQDHRLLKGSIIVRAIGDGLAAQVAEQLLGQGSQLGLGITHSRSAIAIERAEVALAVHQRVTQRERLGHAHHRLVGGLVAMGMVFAQHLAHYRRGLAWLGVAAQTQVLEHGVKEPSLHRLQAIAHVWERPRRDDAQRIVEVAFFCFAAEVCREDALRHG